MIKLGFSVERGDSPGAGTAQILSYIISRLQSADLVIADLTTLNPNVCYELGVRHTLRKVGTIQIFDEQTTGRPLPFNLQGTRTIPYARDFVSVDNMVREICATADDVLQDVENGSSGLAIESDNPVHSRVPSLPFDVARSRDEETRLLQERIDKLRSKLQVFADRYNVDIDAEELRQDDSPWKPIEDRLYLARQGLMPANIMAAATSAMQENPPNEEKFMQALQKLKNVGKFPPAAEDFAKLAGYAAMLQREPIEVSIIEIGRMFHPEDADLAYFERAKKSLSKNESDRQFGQTEFMKIVGFDPEAQKFVQKPDTSSDEFLKSFRTLMDSFALAGDHEKALIISSLLIEEHPHNESIARNHARNLKLVKRFDEAMRWFRSAAIARGSSDLSAVWFGNELHNQELYADAAEVYALACVRDPNDRLNFSHLSWELALYLSSVERGGQARLLREGVASQERALEVIKYGLSAPSIETSLTAQKYFGRAADLLEVDLLVVAEEIQGLDIPRSARSRFATELYDGLKSELTTSLNPVAHLNFTLGLANGNGMTTDLDVPTPPPLPH